MNEKVAEIGEKKLKGNDKTLWLKALSAVQMDNRAYAVNLILPVVINNPGFLEGRQLLRKCQAVAQVEKGGSGTKVFGLSLGGAKGASSKTKSIAKKDPLEALGAIEKDLKNDPFNPELNDLLHDCAARLSMVGTAEFALETIHDHRPEQTKLLHKLANFYTGEKKFVRAAEIFQTIVREDPTDSAAVKGEKDCMAKASMMQGTKEVGGTLNLKMKDDSLRKDLEKKSRTGLTKEQKEERREELMRQYEANNDNMEVVMSLGDVLEQLEDYVNAHAFFSWAYQLSENDKTILSKADTMKNKANDKYIQELEVAVSNDPENAELQSQLLEFKKQANEERILDCEARVQENPTDGLLRYDLGKAYFEAGKANEAIPHLQQAKSNPAIETKVLLLLGKAFDAKGMTDMAISQLQRANERLVIMDGTKKEVLYQSALLHEKSGDNAEYLNCLKLVYEVDFNYRDVSERVEKAYSQGSV